MIGEKCAVCDREGERHHIVYKSQGGLDFPLNYVYLCSWHHRGVNGPHKNRRVDLEYKIEMQKKIEKILVRDFYKMKDFMELLHINKRQAKIITKDFRLYKEGYRTKDIIKRIMGGRLYYDYMLEDNYDDSWEELSNLI